MNLYPAVLTDSLALVGNQVAIAQEFPQLQVVHVDIIDGFFIDNVTVTPSDLPGIPFEPLQLDLHLMVDEPMDLVLEAVPLKDQLPIRAIMAQVEHMSYQAEFTEEVRKHGWKVGLALDLYTPLDAIDELSWPYVDVLHLMSAEAGFQGQPFQSSILDKVTEAQALLEEMGLKPEIVVDGGITVAAIETLQKAKVDSVAVGSSIWTSDNPHQTLQALLAAVNE